MATNYRAFYKKYYDIDFNNDYEIHHIDFNHENNNISNLLLLPKALHQQYHMVIGCLTTDSKHESGFLIDVRLDNALITEYYSSIFYLLPMTIDECSKWLKWKKTNYDQQFKSIIFDNYELLGGIKNGCNKSK